MVTHGQMRQAAGVPTLSGVCFLAKNCFTKSVHGKARYYNSESTCVTKDMFFFH